MVTHAIFSFLADDPVLSHLERLTERSALLLLAGAHRPQRDVTAERHQRPPARPATTPTAPALVLQSQRGEASSLPRSDNKPQSTRLKTVWRWFLFEIANIAQSLQFHAAMKGSDCFKS